MSTTEARPGPEMVPPLGHVESDRRETPLTYGASPLAEEGQSPHLAPRDASSSPSSATSSTYSAPTTSSRLQRLKRHLATPIKVSRLAEVELLILSVCTGMQDATSFPDYHVFASNQTGNTVFLTLALVVPSISGSSSSEPQSQNLFITANIATALSLFLVGGWLTGQLSHVIGPRRRWWLVLCNLLQSLLVLAAAGIQFSEELSGTNGSVAGGSGTGGTSQIQLSGPKALGVISLLAFASGSQVVQSRSLSMTEISTAMATAAWVDLMIDPRLFHLPRYLRPRVPRWLGGRGHGTKAQHQDQEQEDEPSETTRPRNGKKKTTTKLRNRRMMFLTALVSGSLLGAVVYKYVGSATAIAISAAGKMVVPVLYMFNEGEEEKEGGE